MAFSAALELQSALENLPHPESVSLQTLRTVLSRVVIERCVNGWLAGSRGTEWFSHFDSAIAFDLVPSALAAVQVADTSQSEGPEIGLIASPMSDDTGPKYNVSALLKPDQKDTLDKMVEFVHSVADDTDLVSSSHLSSEMDRRRRLSSDGHSEIAGGRRSTVTAVEELTLELEQANNTIRELHEYIEDIAKPALKRVEELDQDLEKVAQERDQQEKLVEERTRMIAEERVRFTESISQISEMIQIREENPEIAEAAEDSIIAISRQATIFDDGESGEEFGTPSISGFKASISEMEMSESATLRRLSRKLTIQPLGGAGSRGSLKRSSLDSSSSQGMSDISPLMNVATAVIPMADFEALKEENTSLRALSNSYKSEIDDLHSTLEDLGQELAATKEDLTFAVQQCTEASTLIAELTNDKSVLMFELETLTKDFEKAMETVTEPVIRRNTHTSGMHVRGMVSGAGSDFTLHSIAPSQNELAGVPEMVDIPSEKSQAFSPTGAVHSHGRYWDSGRMSDIMGMVSPTGQRPYTPVSPGSKMSPRRQRPSALMERLSSRGLITLDENGEVVAPMSSVRVRRAGSTGDSSTVSSVGSDYLGEEEKETPVPIQIKLDLSEVKMRRSVGSVGSGDDIMPVIPEGAVSRVTDHCRFCDQIRKDMEILVNDKLKLQTVNADLQFKCDELSGIQPDSMFDDHKENHHSRHTSQGSFGEIDYNAAANNLTGISNNNNQSTTNSEMEKLLPGSDDKNGDLNKEGFCCDSFQGW